MPILGSQGSQLVRSFLQPLLATISSVSKGAAVGQVIVAFTPANSGPAATSFTVTSSPGNITASGASSPITVSGLTPGTSYTFTVVASNATGNSSPSSPSSSIAASQYICPNGGSPSGATCNYGASASTSYSCPAEGSVLIGCYYNEGQLVGRANCQFFVQNFYDTIICISHPDSSCQSGGFIRTCTASTSYVCSSGGSLSGTTCSYAASVG